MHHPSIIVAGAVTVNPLLVVGGGAVLSSGVSVMQKTYSDPNCSGAELLKTGLVGDVAGAVGTAIAVVASPAIAAAAGIQAVGMAAGVGAAAAGAAHLIKDGADLAIADRIPGITDCRTTDKILSAQNGIQLATACTIGAAAGGVGQAVVNSLAPSAARVTDSVVDSVTSTVSKTGSKLPTAIQSAAALKSTTDKLIEQAEGEIAVTIAKSLPRVIGESLAKNVASASAGFGVTYAGEVVQHLTSGKSFGKACIEAGKSSLQLLPFVAGGVLIGTVIETSACRLQLKVKKDQLAAMKANKELKFRADGAQTDKDGERNPVNGVKAKMHAEEHVGDHHVKPLESAMTRDKVNKILGSTDPTTVWKDATNTTKGVAALFEEVIAQTDGFPHDGLRKTVTYGGVKYKYYPGVGKAKIPGEWRGKIEVEVNRADCGTEVRHDNAGKPLFGQCDRARGCFDVRIEENGNRDFSLKTAYPVNGNNFTSQRPTGAELNRAHDCLKQHNLPNLNGLPQTQTLQPQKGRKEKKKKVGLYEHED